jgi:hypothetical protein
MGVQFHGLADDVGHFLETAVIHVVQRLQDAALDRLQAVVYVGDRPLLDNIGGILNEVFVKEFMEFSQISSFFHGNVLSVEYQKPGPCGRVR